MSEAEFSILRERFAVLMARYFGEARRTADLLAEVTSKPLSFGSRFAILRQQVLENSARDSYVVAKRDFYDIALRGYDCLPYLPPV